MSNNLLFKAQRHRRFCLWILSCALICESTLPAATIVWEDTGTDFETGGNWVGNSAPTDDTTSDTAQFNDASISNQPNLSTSRSVLGLDFDTAGWTLTDSSATLTLGTGGIDSAGAGTNTIDAPITFGASSTWTIDSGNTIAFGNNTDKISGIASYDLTKEGDGTLDLAGSGVNDSVWLGDIVINNGIIEFDSSGGDELAAGTITINSGGTLDVSGAGFNYATRTSTIAGTGEGGIGAVRTDGTATPLIGNITVDAAGALIRFTNNGNIDNNHNNGSYNVTLNGDLTMQSTGASSDLDESLKNTTLSGSGNAIFDLENTGSLGSGIDMSSWSGKLRVIDGSLNTGASNLIGDTTDIDIDDGGTFDFIFYSDTFDQLELEGGATLKNSSFGEVTIEGDITVSGGTSTTAYLDNSDTNGKDFNLDGNSTATTISVASGKTLQINGDLDNALITKTGDGTLELGDGSDSRSNLFTGDVTINAGTVKLNKNDGVNALAGGADVIINSGGTLLMAQNNQINVSTGITLAGGTLDIDGYDEALGNLTLTADSVIDFGTGIGTFDFSSSDLDSVLGSHTLSIWNWSGTANTAGTDGVDDRLIFRNEDGSFTKTTQVAFYSDSGTTFIGNGILVSTTELVSSGVPEPSTYLTGGLLVLIASFWEHRRRRRQATA